MSKKGEFFLKGYFVKQSISFEYIGQVVQLVRNEENVVRFEELKTEEDTVSETGVLRIDSINHNEQKHELAINIKNLLSIALGQRIIFDRQRYWTGNTFTSEERVMANSPNRGDQIVPDFEIENYLQSTLPFWTKCTKKEKDEIFIVTDYLNQTKNDFIEDRILRTVQAWECAANYWVSELELTDDLKDLKERVKRTYKQWKIDKEYIDKDGELGQRLTGPLDQQKLMLRLDKLTKDCGLSTDKIGLNLRRLKDLRDLVAHTGQINMSGAEAIDHLMPGVRALQLILLRRLGYRGLVNGIKNNWRTFNEIDEYFMQDTNSAQHKR
jgi:hypothetical protein